MLTRYIMTHDIGTSSDKAALVTLDGEVIRHASSSYQISCPRPGWQEQNPVDWWQAFCGCTTQLLDGIDRIQVIGVSLTGQMMGCVPVDSQGEPVCPAMIWADSRAVSENSTIEQCIGLQRYYDITGLRPSPTGSVSKIAWLMKNRPDLYQRTAFFLSAKDYVGFRLTGVPAMDPENAAYMYCFDRKKSKWSQEILDVHGIDIGKMPSVIPSTQILGVISKNASEQCGLADGTPVVMATGDGGAVTLGTGTLEKGEAYTSLGTSSWVCAITDPDTVDKECRFAKINYLGTTRDTGAMQAGGYCFNWIRTLLLGDDAARGADCVNHLAEQSIPGSRGVIFLPYLLGERAPYWDPYLRGSFLGLSGTTDRCDLSRSVMEGVGVHLSLIYQLIVGVNKITGVRCMKLVGGGARSWLWQSILADAYGLPVAVPKQAEHVGALGVAVLAGVGLKAFSDVSIIRKFQDVDRVIQPKEENAPLYQKLRSIHIRAKTALDSVKLELMQLEC